VPYTQKPSSNTSFGSKIALQLLRPNVSCATSQDHRLLTPISMQRNLGSLVLRQKHVARQNLKSACAVLSQLQNVDGGLSNISTMLNCLQTPHADAVPNGHRRARASSCRASCRFETFAERRQIGRTNT